MMQATLAAATQNLRGAVRPEFQLPALAFQHLFSNRKSVIRNRRNLNKGKVGFKSNRKKNRDFSNAVRASGEAT